MWDYSLFCNTFITSKINVFNNIVTILLTNSSYVISRKREDSVMTMVWYERCYSHASYVCRRGRPLTDIWYRHHPHHFPVVYRECVSHHKNNVVDHRSKYRKAKVAFEFFEGSYQSIVNIIIPVLENNNFF